MSEHSERLAWARERLVDNVFGHGYEPDQWFTRLVAELETTAGEEWHARFLEQRDACDHHEHELDKAKARIRELEEALRWDEPTWKWAHGHCYVCWMGPSHAPDAPCWEREHGYGEDCSLGGLGVVPLVERLLAPPSQEKPDYRPPVSPSDPENYSRHRPSQGSAQEEADGER